MNGWMVEWMYGLWTYKWLNGCMDYGHINGQMDYGHTCINGWIEVHNVWTMDICIWSNGLCMDYVCIHVIGWMDEINGIMDEWLKLKYESVYELKRIYMYIVHVHVQHCTCRYM